MQKAKKLTIIEAIEAASLIDLTLTAFEETAPQTVAAMGGWEALARVSQMCCIGPMPRLDVETWQRMSEEYEDRRRYGDLAESHQTLGQKRPRRRLRG